jgi:hypothetical protein
MDGAPSGSGIDWLYWALWVSSGFVIAGVALEEEELLRKVADLLKNAGPVALISEYRKRGFKRSLAKFGFVLLVLGLALELGFQAALQIRDEARTREAAWQLEAARIEAAHAIKEAADARIRAAEIEQKYAWRVIDAGQRQKLLKALEGFHFSLDLEFSRYDPEGFEYARQVALALSLTSLKVIPYDIVPFQPGRNVEIKTSPSKESEALAKAFTDAGIKFQYFPEKAINPPLEKAPVRISVGSRDPP